MSTWTPPPLSRRTDHLREASILRALTLEVNRFDDGINLGQGVCDLEMPRELRNGTIESLFQDRATYTPFAGIKPLREQIVTRMKRRYGLDYGIHQIVVTVGSSMAWTATLATLIDPGDEVVLMEPFYPYHFTGARLAGATVKTVPMGLGDDAIDFDALAAAITDRTRIVCVNTPSNPLGKVWTAAELDRLGQVLEDHSCWVVTDEIYEDLVYDGRKHVPPATRPGLADRTITISGVSKSFSITGWRLGWVAAPEAAAKAIGPVFDVMAVCAARPLQAGAAAALRDLPETYFTDLRDDYERRRDAMLKALRGGGLNPRVPEGSYYILADTTERYGDLGPVDACFKLLEEAHVAAIPATIFYATDERPELRFHYAVEDHVIEEVGRRLQASRSRS